MKFLRIFVWFAPTLAAFLLAGVLRADVIQLAPGAQFTVDFAVPGFNPAHPATIFPTTIGLQLAGSVLPGSAVATIPGSTAGYYSGILLQATLQSLNGSAVLSLFDADAWRLGLPTGDLVADATGGNTAMADATVAVSINAAQAIFGTTGEAMFVVTNLGATVTIGLGPNYSLSNAILVPLTSGSGQTAGHVESIGVTTLSPAIVTSTSVPEPARLSLAVTVVALISLGVWMKTRVRQ